MVWGFFRKIFYLHNFDPTIQKFQFLHDFSLMSHYNPNRVSQKWCSFIASYIPPLISYFFYLIFLGIFHERVGSAADFRDGMVCQPPEIPFFFVMLTFRWPGARIHRAVVFYLCHRTHTLINNSLHLRWTHPTQFYFRPICRPCRLIRIFVSSTWKQHGLIPQSLRTAFNVSIKGVILFRALVKASFICGRFC